MHSSADQAAVFAFLSDPATYGLSEPVKRIDTHGAVVFLAGPDVYKVKRAIRFAYMDFSTLDLRRKACEAEIEVNRHNAPGLYVGTVPVTRGTAGCHLGGKGEVVEWAVHLRRFDEDATLDRIAEKGALGPTLVDQLTQAVMASHRRAPRREGRSAAASLRQVLNETLDEVVESGDVLDETQAETLCSDLVTAFDHAEPLLLRRGAQGYVRRCHGDLHLRNVVLIRGEPILFDALEFDEAIATTDILYDLAFLIMDLCERGLRADANRLLNLYIQNADDELAQIEGLALLPMFMSLRAAIRAKVTVAQFRIDSNNALLRCAARTYLEAALQFLTAVPPRLVAIGGLSGTGKTTLATAIAPSFGSAPGALHFRSDIERKHLFSVADTVQLPLTAYQTDVSDEVYTSMWWLAEAALRAGSSVVVDATYRHAADRERIESMAAKTDATFVGLWLDASTELRTKRVSDRQGDASDATAELAAAQVKEDIGVVEWHHLDASPELDELSLSALHFLL